VPSAGVEPASPASEAGVVSVGPRGRRPPGARTPNPLGKNQLLVQLSLRPAEDAGVEPARRSRADHRFRDGCLTGLGQSSSRGARSRTWSGALSGRCTDRHAPPRRRAAEGARIERAPDLEPGPRISNPVPYRSASPPNVLLVEGSNLGLRVQSPASVPAGPTSIGTPTRIRTWTERVLSALPLPLGYRGVEPLLGVEPSSSRLRDGRSHRSSSRGKVHQRGCPRTRTWPSRVSTERAAVNAWQPSRVRESKYLP